MPSRRTSPPIAYRLDSSRAHPPVSPSKLPCEATLGVFHELQRRRPALASPPRRPHSRSCSPTLVHGGYPRLERGWTTARHPLRHGTGTPPAKRRAADGLPPRAG